MAVVWITGARGFIGQHLSVELRDRGHCVAGIGHGHWDVTEFNRVGLAHWMNSEIHGSSLDSMLALAGRPSLIFHLAGGSTVGASFANPFEDFERTVQTTVRLMDWVRSRCPDCGVVAVSSAAVYGSVHSAPISEAAVAAPYSPYGYHKWMMESVLRSYGQNFGLRGSVVRLFSAYGTGLRKQLLWDFCSKLRSADGILTLDGSGDERRDWIEVRDIARLLASVAVSNVSESVPTLNGGTGIAMSVREVAEALLRAIGVEAEIRFSGRRRTGDPNYLVADVATLGRSGFKHRVSVEQGFREYAAWFETEVGRT